MVRGRQEPCRIANVPALAVRRGRETAEINAWTFLTPLSDVKPEDYPLDPALRQAFGCAHETSGALVPRELWAHRTMMFQRHLPWPIAP
jgi:hypothetical protein